MFRGGVCVTVLAVFVMLNAAAQPTQDAQRLRLSKEPTLLKEIIVTATRTALQQQ